MLMQTEGLPWDGTVHFGVIDQLAVERLGLMDDIPGLLKVIESGRMDWKRKHVQKNKVTNYARQYLATVLAQSVTGALILPNQTQLGTGTGTPAATDTDLWNPVAGTLKPCSGIQVYLTYYAQFVTAWQTSDPIQGSWSEIGLKDVAGNLWAHAAITSNLTVNDGELLVSQWQVQILGN